MFKISAKFIKKLNYFQFSQLTSIKYRSSIFLILSINICSITYQQAYHFHVTLLNRYVNKGCIKIVCVSRLYGIFLISLSFFPYILLQYRFNFFKLTFFNCLYQIFACSEFCHCLLYLSLLFLMENLNFLVINLSDIINPFHPS